MRLAAPMSVVATGFSCRDQDHRRALQSLLPGKLPRADRHHLRLRSGLNAILPDGRAATRGVDEAASGRAPGGVALRDRQTGWQGSLGFAQNLRRPGHPLRLYASRSVQAAQTRQGQRVKAAAPRSAMLSYHLAVFAASNFLWCLAPARLIISITRRCRSSA